MSCLLILACASQFLMGQTPPNYTQVPYNIALYSDDPKTKEKKLDEKKVNQLRSLKGNIVAGTAAYAENAANLTNWYRWYQLPSFTQLDQCRSCGAREILDDMRRARIGLRRHQGDGQRDGQDRGSDSGQAQFSSGGYNALLPVI
jgi:hypothetical protein